MAEESERIQETFEYTYTIDEFTVFFYSGHVYVGGKEYPIGQCSVDIMNLDEPVLDEIDRRAKICVSEAIDLLTEKTDSASHAGETERCLEYRIYSAGVPGSEHGQGGQLPHL